MALRFLAAAGPVAFVAMALVASCAPDRPPYVLQPQSTSEDLYANPRQCGWEEWHAYDQREKDESLTDESLARTHKLVALGHEVALIGNGKFQLLDTDTKSVKHLDMPDWVLDAGRVGSRIWLLTQRRGDGILPARI